MNIHQREKRVVKKTLVTITARGVARTYLLDLEHDEKGRAFIPQHTLERLLEQRGIRRGETYTIG